MVEATLQRKNTGKCPPPGAAIPAGWAYDILGEHYDQSFQREIDLAENEAVFDLFRQKTGSLTGRDILDLGCGTGLFLEHVKVSPRHYTGVDISKTMLRQAKMKFPRFRFLQADMKRLRFQPESFDIAVSFFGSFSYCRRPYRAVSEIRRVLRPGGKVFLMAFGPGYAAEKPDFTEMGGYQVQKLCWRNRPFRLLFSGFRITECFGFSWLPNRLDWSRKALARLLKLEAKTIGRLWPDQCFFQVVIGEKIAPEIPE